MQVSDFPDDLLPDTMTKEADSAPPPDYPLTEVKPTHKRTWRGAKIVDKSRFLTIGEGCCRLHFNPVVSFCSIILVIAFILWCILEPVRKLELLIDLFLLIFDIEPTGILLMRNLVLILKLMFYVCRSHRKTFPDANSSFKSAKTWVTMTFTWLYVGSQDIWAVVIIAIYFSKYGQMKLG